MRACVLSVVMVALALTGCGESGGAADGCVDQLLPGDLVITEVFADFAPPPDSSGVDDGQEWFEIYNAANRPLDLTGLVVTHSRGSGEMARALRLPALTIQAGEYLVLGNAADDLRPGWVDVGYGAGLGDLYNSGDGTIALQCGSAEIDRAVYAEVTGGRSRQLDGGDIPDYTANDSLTGWCEASRVPENEFTPNNFGTPGAPNEDCEIVVPGQCKDGDVLRPTVAPAPGDLVITEVMPNPAAVGDTVGEWFEVTALRDVDLNGLGLDRIGDSTNPKVLQAEACLRVTAGAVVLFARSTDAGVNGGLPAPITDTFAFSLISGAADAPGDVALLIGSTVIDAVTWTSSRSGKALQVDPDAATADANDDLTSWCDATQPYGDGDFGTPAAPNAECAAVAPPGTCLDGTTSRPLVIPEVGDLVITEVMPNPDAVSDTVGEWFEVQAVRAVDLNGVGLDRAGDTANPTVISSAACRRIAAGERVIFARSSDSTSNGGLPAVTAGFTFALVSGTPTAPGDVRLMVGADVLDAVTWTSSRAGASRALDPNALDVTTNDSEAAWCDGISAYGDGDLGTPAAANTSCGNVPMPDTCLDDGTARPRVPPLAGDLVITEVMPNPGVVSDTLGEWVEVLVTRDVDLNGVGLDRASDSASPIVITQPACVRVRAGTRLVFAKDADPTVNGGLPPVLATFSFALIDGTLAAPGDVQLVLGATLLDAFAWAGAVSGTSIQVDPDAESPTGNDAAAAACRGTLPYGDGDLGTPSDTNLECGPTATVGTCLDGTTSRPIVRPAAGQLVITEYLANPANVTGFSDAQREWFEVANTGATAFDLNELGLSRDCTSSANVVTAASCLVVAPGGHALFARQGDPMVNAMLPIVDATFTFSLVDADGGAQVCDGTTILDQITWASVTPGRAAQLDPDLTTAVANDLTASSCLATTIYGDGSNQGTPRAANAQCP